MKPRPQPLPVPDGHRFWVVDMSAWREEQITSASAAIAEARTQLEQARAGLTESPESEELAATALNYEAKIEVLGDGLSGAERSMPHGEIHFRMPRYSIGHAIARVAGESQRPGDYLDKTISSLPVIGAVLGLCWHDRGFALETPLPADLGVAALLAYGECVEDELQDRFTLAELRALYIRVMPEIQQRLDITQAAAQRADFFEAQEIAQRGASR